MLPFLVTWLVGGAAAVFVGKVHSGRWDNELTAWGLSAVAVSSLFALSWWAVLWAVQP